MIINSSPYFKIAVISPIQKNKYETPVNNFELTQDRRLKTLPGYRISFGFLKIRPDDKRECIDTNGERGYSYTTILGPNNRRTHALLTLALNPPVDKKVILSKIDETIEIAGDKIEISEVEFDVLPVPIWKYDLGKNKILTKQLAMPSSNGNINSVVIGYTYSAPEDALPVTLTLKPIMAYRDFNEFSPEAELSGDVLLNILP